LIQISYIVGMSTTSDGRNAESHVAEELKSRGHTIVTLNWRTRRCEIDIVSTYNKAVYFTEVKYRGSSHWGTGLDYITPAKLRQMHFAAELWLAENNWTGESALMAAEVDRAGDIELVEI